MSIIKRIPLSSGTDKRGFSWFPFEQLPQFKDKPLLNFHIAELKPGALRGNHYHPLHKEYFLLCGSQFHLTVKDLDGNKEEEIFSDNPEFLFIIPPNIRHTVKNVGIKTGYFVGFLEGEGEIKTIR